MLWFWCCKFVGKLFLILCMCCSGGFGFFIECIVMDMWFCLNLECMC